MGGSPGRAATCALAVDVAREPQGAPGLHGERSTFVLAREALGPAASQPVAQDTTVSLAIEVPMLLQACKELSLECILQHWGSSFLHLYRHALLCLKSTKQGTTTGASKLRKASIPHRWTVCPPLHSQ